MVIRNVETRHALSLQGKKKDTSMNNFKQLNRSYDNMRENQYIAECDKIMISVLDHPLISKALEAAMNYIAVAEYEQLSHDYDY